MDRDRSSILRLAQDALNTRADGGYEIHFVFCCPRCGTRCGRRRVFFYGCLAHSKPGGTVCSNRLVRPVTVVDEAVLGALAGDALRPEVVLAVVDAVFEALQPAAVTMNMEALYGDLRAQDARIANLTAVIEEGAAVAPLVAQLQARQTEREALLAAIARAKAVQDLALDRRAIERAVLQRVETWRALLTRQVTDGRQLLREVLEGPLRFTPEGRSCRIEQNDSTDSRHLARRPNQPATPRSSGWDLTGP